MVTIKGADDYAVARMAQDLKNLGYRRTILKSDPEPSIKVLKEEGRMRMTEEVMLEESPVGESQRNGEVERAAK